MVEALAGVRAITGAAQASICALCSGGIVTSMVAAHLGVTGQLDQLASLCLGVTVLDQALAGTAAALVDETTVAAAMAASAAPGYLDGRALAEVFAWLRPDDLIWNYWVNNYLRGRPPPAFDILYWNADTTRLPAALHHDFIRLGLANALTVPGAATMLFGGPVRFVLSTSGHIAALVNAPGNQKASFRSAPSDHGAPSNPVTRSSSWPPPPRPQGAGGWTLD